MEKGLGRRHAPDERDRAYLLPHRKAEAKAIRRKSWSSPGPILDQKATSECVGYSTWRWLTSGPVCNKPPFTPTDLYTLAKKADEWPGEDYPGTSVRGAFKALKEAGYISEYKWAFTCEAAIDHVLTVGPMVLGTRWFERMFEPERGYIIPGGPGIDGHAWLLIGADRDRKNPDGTVGAGRMINSWGRAWGQAGRAWVTFHHLDELIQDAGEAAVASEILRK